MLRITYETDLRTVGTIESVRIRRALIRVPSSCKLWTNNSLFGESEEEEEVIDVARNLTSWLASSTSSQFTVNVPCVGWNSSNIGEDVDLIKWTLKVTLDLNTGVDRKLRTKRSSLRKRPINVFVRNVARRGKNCKDTQRGKSCCRNSLKMSFLELGIKEVIQPPDFEAHVCQGRCKARRLNYTTNHAMFQHILHQKLGKKVVPRPCCVPTKLGDLDILYMNPITGEPDVNILKNVVVQECGCS